MYYRSDKSLCLTLGLVAVVLALCPPPALAQGRGSSPPNWTQNNNGAPIGDLSAIVVHVREPAGGPLTIPALVVLTSVDIPSGIQTATGPGATAQFNGLRGGDYTVEVNAAGYKAATQQVTLLGDNGIVNEFITLERDDGQRVEAGQLDTPLLVGKARRELDLAVAALRANKPADAASHVAYILKHAPGNPDVQYVAALYSLDVKEEAAARAHLEAAVNILPQYSAAQLELASLLLEGHDAAGAIAHLERALAAHPNSWRAHGLIAEAYLDANQDVERAKFHAAKALELGKAAAAGVEITLARAEALSGEREAAYQTLQEFLKTYPQHSEAARARQMLSALEQLPAKPAPQQIPVVVPSLGTTAGAGNLSSDVPANSMLRLPKDVDDEIPPVQASIPCSLSQVLQGASQRALEFTVALERFSAREEVVEEELDGAGVTQRAKRGAFNYVAALEHPSPHTILVDEMRDGQFSLDNFPAPLASEGLPAQELIFHPDYAEDFTFSCEGLGEWRGEPAWQVHFRERDDRPLRFRQWVIADRSYPVQLKGRAWISAHTYQPLHLETDLVEPITLIALDYEHSSVDYAPVKFPDGKRQLWLPARAEVYSRFRGHSSRQRHEFSDFVLFSVQTKETANTPHLP
jgi:tetratricopeptide (TPR) repeat protein